MKVKTYVEWSDEVEVEVSKEQILEAFSESPEPGESWFQVLNRFAFALRTLPQATIDAWTPGQRKTVYDFLSQQTQRFGAHEEEAHVSPTQ